VPLDQTGGRNLSTSGRPFKADVSTRYQ